MFIGEAGWTVERQAADAGWISATPASRLAIAHQYDAWPVNALHISFQ